MLPPPFTLQLTLQLTPRFTSMAVSAPGPSPTSEVTSLDSAPQFTVAAMQSSAMVTVEGGVRPTATSTPSTTTTTITTTSSTTPAAPSPPTTAAPSTATAPPCSPHLRRVRASIRAFSAPRANEESGWAYPFAIRICALLVLSLLRYRQNRQRSRSRHAGGENAGSWDTTAVGGEGWRPPIPPPHGLGGPVSAGPRWMRLRAMGWGYGYSRARGRGL
ncbi:hypothetical protein HO173_006628 [Letharia columbiana]|uniref:Uncharacterized protein n=1 Tax=Letharia columbiana TaxID=112416 RepID=A0A8H6FV95_9LECA|nr:uncharacterized protein HO173_006628 [Letharia columbiana]KAF6235432.1 hypothetical protein HO173_006628 [Letharia columbiana]